MKIILNLFSKLPRPHLSNSQYRYSASIFKTIGETMILGSSAAYFLPETLQIKEPILINRYIILFGIGLIMLIIGGIFEKVGNND